MSLATLHNPAPQLLTSAAIYVWDRKNKPVKCRALLDTCASANLVSESIIKRLGIHVVKQSLPITTINDMNTQSKGVVRITIQSIHDGYSKELTCLTIPAIADLIPSEIFPRDSINLPANIRLADPEFHLPRPIDLLIGSGATLSLLSVGQINLTHKEHDLYLQKTRLGWVVAGGTISQTPSNFATYNLTTLNDLIAKFWTIEEVAVDKPKSQEEIECEAHYVETVSRDNSGRYTVRLPFRNMNRHLGESRNIALKRLAAVERKLNADVTLKNEYNKVLEEYLTLDHMSRVDNPSDDGYYMPHHAVVKETSNTTKVRIVFDASAKTDNGLSLNDVLLVGPTIQNNLVSHLIRFRAYQYVITADIEKMFRQVWLHENDRRYQRILWRRSHTIETFQLNILAFGVASSPFLAIRTVRRLAEDERHRYPRAAEILENHLYVDDLLTGAETIDKAREIREEITALLACGGFTIRQWASNDERVIHGLEPEALHANFVLNIHHTLKTLGVTWNTRDDKIYYTTSPINIAERLTKRNILSEIAKIFDPLGLLGPVILYAKKLMQDVWRCNLHWDESVPQAIHTEWLEFARQWSTMNQISFDRKVLVAEHNDIQLHGFCDASSVGYGACLYIRSRGQRENTTIRLLCAKSRVAPLKTVTIPRLELCAALLLAQLYREISDTTEIVYNRVVFWCDSTIVLCWLQTPPHLLRTYVANRVAAIGEITETIEWRHVRSEDNPADAISRGQLPHVFLRNPTWFTGPSWLVGNETEWPNEITQIKEVPELKGNTCMMMTEDRLKIWDRYSSYSKLLRIVAYCFRVLLSNKHSGALKADEINKAEIRVIKLLQAERFSDEIKGLKSNSTSKGRFANLNPFLDDDDLIRVGGRLQMSSLTFSQKHPILLPNRHRLTDHIIRGIHETHHHAGIQTTLYLLRQKFWLPDGRNQVRKIIRTCVRCHRFDAKTVDYRMGNLPKTRVRSSVPFTNTGVDFCGPFFIKERKYRNRTRIKTYVCVFVCMTIKAIHLEVVSDLSTDGFIAALRRFIARRGIPEHIYSDNGTNFVGANNKLREVYALFNSGEHKERIDKFSSEHRITWHFIPPFAPHFGGLWESSVKLFKHHFKRVIGDSLFTFEELNTFTTEVEGILNSRPIATISSDPNDMMVLSPAHYLIGKPITSLPDTDLSSVPANRMSTWQHITKVRQDFWTRWNLEYLNELQMRNKWQKDGSNVEVGTVVLIKEKNLPCTQWAIGRIKEIYPGADGVIRTVMVQTANSEMKRPVKLLCPLPIEQ